MNQEVGPKNDGIFPIQSTIRRLVRRTRKSKTEDAPPVAAEPEPTATDPDDPDAGKQIYWLRPAYGGFANNVIVRTDSGDEIYHVKSQLFAPTGRRYIVYNVKTDCAELYTRQDHTCLFPRHKVFRGDDIIARVGQNSIIPEAYFIQIGKQKIDVKMSGLSSIYPVMCGEELLAEAGQGSGCWCVVMKPELVDPLLPLIAIVYRENTIGG